MQKTEKRNGRSCALSGSHAKKRKKGKDMSSPAGAGFGEKNK
jgi:hypothetical protein